MLSMELNVLKTATADRPRTKMVSKEHCYKLILDFMVSDEGGIMIISQRKKTVKNGVTFPYVVAVWLDGDYWTLRWFGKSAVKMIKVPLTIRLSTMTMLLIMADIYAENLKNSTVERIYNNKPGRVILCQK